MPGTFHPPPQISDPDKHHGTCVTHGPWCMPGSLTSGFLWSRWRGKRSRHSRRMRNPQFYVSGKRSIGAIIRLPQCQQSNPGENEDKWINPLSIVNQYCSAKPYIGNVYLLLTLWSIRSLFKDYKSRQPLWIVQSQIIDSVFEIFSIWRSFEIND